MYFPGRDPERNDREEAVSVFVWIAARDKNITSCEAFGCSIIKSSLHLSLNDILLRDLNCEYEESGVFTEAMPTAAAPPSTVDAPIAIRDRPPHFCAKPIMVLCVAAP